MKIGKHTLQIMKDSIISDASSENEYYASKFFDGAPILEMINNL